MPNTIHTKMNDFMTHLLSSTGLPFSSDSPVRYWEKESAIQGRVTCHYGQCSQKLLPPPTPHPTAGLLATRAEQREIKSPDHLCPSTGSQESRMGSRVGTWTHSSCLPLQHFVPTNTMTPPFFCREASDEQHPDIGH